MGWYLGKSDSEIRGNRAIKKILFPRRRANGRRKKRCTFFPLYHDQSMLYYYRFSGGVVIVYERKVKLLYDDVTHLLAWKVKAVADPTLLPKGKNQARKEKITLPENQHIDFGDVEQSLNFTNAASTMRFEQPSYVAMIFIPIHRQKFQYLDSLKGRDPEVLKLLDIALPKELIRPLLPPNPYLISTKVDCNRLNDSAIQLLFRPSLRELYLHSCSDFSGKLLYEIGQSCPELRFVCNFSRSTRKWLFLYQLGHGRIWVSSRKVQI